MNLNTVHDAEFETVQKSKEEEGEEGEKQHQEQVSCQPKSNPMGSNRVGSRVRIGTLFSICMLPRLRLPFYRSRRLFTTSLHTEPLSIRPRISDMSHLMSVTFLGTSSGGGPSESRNCSSLVADVLGDGSLWSARSHAPFFCTL